MEFTQGTREGAYRRAGGRCECTSPDCLHHLDGTRCNAPLTTRWHPRPVLPATTGGTDALSNCIALCTSCHDSEMSREEKRE